MHIQQPCDLDLWAVCGCVLHWDSHIKELLSSSQANRQGHPKTYVDFPQGSLVSASERNHPTNVLVLL